MHRSQKVRPFHFQHEAIVAELTRGLKLLFDFSKQIPLGLQFFDVCVLPSCHSHYGDLGKHHRRRRLGIRDSPHPQSPSLPSNGRPALKQFERTNVSYVAIFKWIRKYVALMEQYARALRPQLSGVWHVDEMKVNVHGKWHWLWNIMDSDTRYILASHVAQGRGAVEAQEALHIAKKNSNPEGEPTFLISDGLASYQTAVSREFRNTVHLSHVGIQGEVNNNRIERFHGTVRERNKVMRAVKKPNTSIIEGQRIYYNHIRPHMGLGGKIPAEAARLTLGLGVNKWKSIIEKSADGQNEMSAEHE